MEILFRGTPPEERKWKGTCWYCWSQVQAMEKEVTTTEVEVLGETKIIGLANCPVCDREMTFHPEYE